MSQRCRVISGLRHVEVLKESPWGKTRLSGMARQGKLYENLIAKALPTAQHGPWLSYYDSNGLGCCSPDLVLKIDGKVWVLEVKLTLVEEAFSQLESLYIPVISYLLKVPVRGMVVVKAIGRGWRGIQPESSLLGASRSLAKPFPVLLASITTRAHLKAQFSLTH